MTLAGSLSYWHVFSRTDLPTYETLNQRRQDLAFRMDQQNRAYGQGTGLYNAAQAQKSAKAGAIYGGIGDAISYAAMGA